MTCYQIKTSRELKIWWSRIEMEKVQARLLTNNSTLSRWLNYVTKGEVNSTTITLTGVYDDLNCRFLRSPFRHHKSIIIQWRDFDCLSACARSSKNVKSSSIASCGCLWAIQAGQQWIEGRVVSLLTVFPCWHVSDTFHPCRRWYR